MSAAPNDPVSDADLHALVDGQLAANRVSAVHDWLREHPDDAQRVALWQAQRVQLKRLHRSLLQSDTPAALLRTVTRPAQVWRRQAVAAALVLLGVGLGVGGGIGWGVRGGASPAGTAGPVMFSRVEPAFVRDAFMAHAVFVPERRHPVEVSAADEAHLVQWLTRRLGTPVMAPSLLDRGFRLLGGRLLPGPEVPRAQFMYEDAQGQRLTLYVSVLPTQAAAAEVSFRSVRQGGVESFYWIEGPAGYALSGALPAAEMQALAREVHRQLMP